MSMAPIAFISTERLSRYRSNSNVCSSRSEEFIAKNVSMAATFFCLRPSEQGQSEPEILLKFFTLDAPCSNKLIAFHTFTHYGNSCFFHSVISQISLTLH